MAKAAEGRPARSDGRVRGPNFFLWHDVDGWHLHTRTAGKLHGFSGTIKVAGGKIYELKGIGRLEKTKDFGTINRTENEIQFKFRTAEYGDGLDFKVNDDVMRLEFDLKINGYGHPEQIHIGTSGDSPSSSNFTIPFEPKSK